MAYKEISEKTFGSTPAAMYLARELNTLKDPVALRNCGKRITATTKQVAELCYAYEQGIISPRTLANTLRLMREEVANDYSFETDVFVNRLRRNVQIGAIKQGIRLATVARNCERVMEVTHRMIPCETRVNGEVTANEYAFFDMQSGQRITAGFVVTDTENTKIVKVSRYSPEDVDVITPDLLHARSNKRCRRLGKAHIK